jgi:hypothetical protein
VLVITFEVVYIGSAFISDMSHVLLSTDTVPFFHDVLLAVAVFSKPEASGDRNGYRRLIPTKPCSSGPTVGVRVLCLSYTSDHIFRHPKEYWCGPVSPFAETCECNHRPSNWPKRHPQNGCSITICLMGPRWSFARTRRPSFGR